MRLKTLWQKFLSLFVRQKQEPPPPQEQPELEQEKQAQERLETSEQKAKRTRGPNIEPLRREAEDKVNELLEMIGKFDMHKTQDRHLGSWIAYEDALSDLLACDFHVIADLAANVQNVSRIYVNPNHADNKEVTEIMWPLDIGMVRENKKQDFTEFSRMWPARHSELRGKVNIVPNRTAWLATLFVSEREWYAQKTPIGWINGRWHCLDRGMSRIVRDASPTGSPIKVYNNESKEFNDDLNEIASLLQSVALTERYSWHVALGNNDGVRLILPTNPKGCLDFFRKRQKQEGETRQAALRHWVTSHYRNMGDDDIAYVCEHLRGATLFNWRDLECEIFVSQFDLEKNEFFRQQAKEWRAQRKHNRVKVRLKNWKQHA